MKIDISIEGENTEWTRTITNDEYNLLVTKIPKLVMMKNEISNNPNYECYIIYIEKKGYTIVHQGPRLGQVLFMKYKSSIPMRMLKIKNIK